MLTDIQLEYSKHFAEICIVWNDKMKKVDIAREALKASRELMIDIIQEKINVIEEKDNGK